MSILPFDPRVFRKYKVVSCPRCGELQAIRATSVFRCRYCGYREKMARVRILYATDDAREIVEAVKRLRERYGGRVR